VDHYGPASDKLVGIMILIAQSYRGCCSYDEAETFINEVGSEVFQPCTHSLHACMDGWMDGWMDDCHHMSSSSPLS